MELQDLRDIANKVVFSIVIEDDDCLRLLIMFRVQSKMNLTTGMPVLRRWARITGLLAITLLLSNCGDEDQAGDSDTSSFVSPGEEFDRNNLGAEMSSMLRSNADSKVHWQTFSPELVAEAERINRPLLLLVSTREGLAGFNGERLFEDQDFTALINSSFIPVMVDADERPDLGAFYVELSVFLQRFSLWPMVFATTPDGIPIEPMPREINGKLNVGQAVSWARAFSSRWRLNSRQLKEQSNQLSTSLDKLLQDVSELREEDHLPTQAELVSSAYTGLTAVSDDEFGTFTKERSFIRPTTLSAVIRLSSSFNESDYRKARTEALARKSLDTMQVSGIYDHVFGGWYRDSDRPTWNSPRGGKYIIDQAEMIIAYLDGYRAFDDSRYLETARKTGDFILNFLQSKDGQFRHGMFSRSDFGLKSPIYWRLEDIRSMLDDEQYKVVKTLSKLSRYGNIPSLKDDGESRANVLAILEDPEVAAATLNLDKYKMMRIWNGALDELQKNQQRLNLWGADDFALLGESSRTINALIYLWKVTGDDKYFDGALNGMNFLQENVLRGKPAEWPRLWSRGGSKTTAFTEDLLALSLASLRMFEMNGDAAMLELSILAADHVFSKHHAEAGDRVKLLKRFEMWGIEWRSSDDRTTPNVHGLGLEVSSGLAVITGQDKWLNHYDDLSLATKRISNDWLLFASGSSLNETLKNPRETKVFIVPSSLRKAWHPEFLKAWKEAFPQELTLLRAPEEASATENWEAKVSSDLLKAVGASKLSTIEPLK